MKCLIRFWFCWYIGHVVFCLPQYKHMYTCTHITHIYTVTRSITGTDCRQRFDSGTQTKEKHCHNQNVSIIHMYIIKLINVFFVVVAFHPLLSLLKGHFCTGIYDVCCQSVAMGRSAIEKKRFSNYQNVFYLFGGGQHHAFIIIIKSLSHHIYIYIWVWWYFSLGQYW